MTRIYLIQAALTGRLRRLLARLPSDRGDSPVPTAVIIAGLVVLAVAVVAWVYVAANDFMGEAPTELPDEPGFPGGGE